MRNAKTKQLLVCLFSVSIFTVYGQITLQECQKLAKEHYPLSKQRGLIEQSEKYTIAIANAGYWPQIVLSGKAGLSYYPGMEMDARIKNSQININTTLNIKATDIYTDQYQAGIEISQVIWDGGAIRNQKKIYNASAIADKAKLEIDLYKLKDRVNNLYFGLLLIDEQVKQIDLLNTELERKLVDVLNYIEEGIASEADKDLISVEILNLKQNRISLTSKNKAFRKMLSLMIGQEVNALTWPSAEMPNKNNINRPEVNYFLAQEKQLSSQEKMLTVKQMPQIGLFAKGIYGNGLFNQLRGGVTPIETYGAFNLDIKNSSGPFVSAGVKISWQISSFYTSNNEKRKIQNLRQNIYLQKETFEFNTQLAQLEQQENIDKIKAQMKDDDLIIQLRENIRQAAELKAKSGVITVSEMLREVYAESNAKQTRTIHQLELLIAIYKYKEITNN